MRLPFDLLSQNYVRPRLYLCQVNKEKICELDTLELKGSFKFNAYSELTFAVSRTYTNMITGETSVNPFYDQIEALRLVYLEGFGYFEIQDPEIVSDGIKEVKNVTAYGLEYRLSQKYLENFKINTGEVDSLEVIEASGSRIIPIKLVNAADEDLSLTDLVLEKIYDWSWGHIDESLKTMTRQFDISRASVYDFIVQDLCEKFNCYAIFDTIDNKINLYAEALITKHIGDGFTQTFVVSPAYESLGAVSIDSYKTTKYEYRVEENASQGRDIGYVTFDTPPANGAKIEITDGSQSSWQTDVYVTFDNLAQEVNVSYSAEDIKTVLTVKGEDDLDIREVNMGLPYIVDLSYYYNVDWMGRELYDAYTKYILTCNDAQDQYSHNATEMLELIGRITYETNRLSLQYSIASHVTSTTVGTYYVRCGAEDTGFYYKEVNLPDEYSANVDVYYTLSGSDLNEDKFSKLYTALKTYYSSDDQKDTSEIVKLKDDFKFVADEFDALTSTLSTASALNAKKQAVLNFFDLILDQLGKAPLETLYLHPYQKIEATNKEAGWNDIANVNYWNYYPATLVIEAVQKEIKDRDDVIKAYQDEYGELKESNNQLSNDASIYNNFTHEQLMMLSPFLREDEYADDNFVETDSDSIEKLMQTKQELLECGKIELAKLCEPKLSFSMDMANIYALIEFEPIIHQFQLGNLINVAIRKDYVKKARLLAVDINFDDFSDFSCEFGELTHLKTQSSIHADLLANALSAGSSVASNQSYWEKGADLATSTDIKIQNGLLSAVDGIYNADKSVLIDNHGILLRKVEDNGEYSPYQIWLTNNNILFSTDGFDSAQTGIGMFEVNGRELYGVLAKAVLAGYIEGSDIVGGTINIGDGKFIVDQFGNVTMNAASISGYATSKDLSGKVSTNQVISSINQSPESIAIDANKISLKGKQINLTSDNITIDSTNFSVTKDGKITATSGEIAGWTINPTFLRKDLTLNGVDYQMYLQAPDGESSVNAFAVRTKATGSATWDNQFVISYTGKLTAKNANIAGTITAENGSIAGYNIGPGGSYDNAIYKRIQGDGADYEVGLKATSGDTDLAFYVKESADSWDSSSNVFYVRNNGQLYAENAIIKGEIESSSGSIGGFDISDLYLRSDITKNGTRYQTFLQAADGTNTTTAFAVRTSTDGGSTWTYQTRINYDGSATMKNANVTGTIHASDGNISGNLSIDGSLTHTKGNYTVTLRGVQSDVDKGVFYITDNSSGSAEYPVRINGDGSARFTNVTITGSSTIASACIPNLNANKITAGTLDVGRIPNISADKITSGTISTARLDASVITTGNFSSKTLSTSNLTVASGCRLGVASEYNALIRTVGDYTYIRGYGPDVNYETSFYNLVKYVVQNSSSQDIKSEIHDFDDRYDIFFDKLKPQLFRYNFEPNMGYTMGYIWQEAEQARIDAGLERNDIGAITETDSVVGGLALSKQDFIALNTWQIQKLKTRIEELENKLEALERNDTK